MEIDNAALIVQRFYSHLAAGNGTEALALLNPDIEWTEAEHTPYFVGAMHGIQAVVSGLFEPLRRDFDTLTAIPHEFVSEGERVVAFGIYSGFAKKSGRALLAPFAHSWTVSRGRLARFVQYTDPIAWNEALAARQNS